MPTAKQWKDWSRLSAEDRILAQWRASFGTPLSDEAKSQFCINACGKCFRLSDVRLWNQHHPRQSNGKEVCEQGKVHLEFFFDGCTAELSGQEDAFNKAFEDMVEAQLQERRVVEFRKKLAARRRRGAGGEAEDADGEAASDQDWKTYLHKPVPASDFSIRSFREAGCMITLLVCQTSLTVSASEVLGQIAFQEHFPIDGVAQGPSGSTKPLPRWVYGLGAFTASMAFFALVAWWQVMRTILYPGGERVLGPV